MKALGFGVAAVALAVLAAPASAGTVTGEVRFNDNNFAALGDTTTYELGYSTNVDAGVLGDLQVGGQVETTDGYLSSTAASLDVAKRFALPLDITASVGGELGRVGYDIPGIPDYSFWGVEATAERQVVGPVSAEVGLRHRDAIGSDNFYAPLLGAQEDRYSVGVNYELTNDTTVGVDFSRTNRENGWDSDAVGVNFRHAL